MRHEEARHWGRASSPRNGVTSAANGSRGRSSRSRGPTLRRAFWIVNAPAARNDWRRSFSRRPDVGSPRGRDRCLFFAQGRHDAKRSNATVDDEVHVEDKSRCPSRPPWPASCWSRRRLVKPEAQTVWSPAVCKPAKRNLLRSRFIGRSSRHALFEIEHIPTDPLGSVSCSHLRTPTPFPWRDTDRRRPKPSPSRSGKNQRCEPPKVPDPPREQPCGARRRRSSRLWDSATPKRKTPTPGPSQKGIRDRRRVFNFEHTRPWRP